MGPTSGKSIWIQLISNMDHLWFIWRRSQYYWSWLAGMFIIFINYFTLNNQFIQSFPFSLVFSIATLLPTHFLPVILRLTRIFLPSQNKWYCRQLHTDQCTFFIFNIFYYILVKIINAKPNPILDNDILVKRMLFLFHLSIFLNRFKMNK